MNTKEVKASEILQMKITAADKELLRRLAESQGRSMSNMVVTLIREAAQRGGLDIGTN